MGPKGGYFLKSGAEGRVFLKEWYRGEGISARVGPGGGYFLKSRAGEGNSYRIRAYCAKPFNFSPLLIDSRLLFCL